MNKYAELGFDQQSGCMQGYLDLCQTASIDGGLVLKHKTLRTLHHNGIHLVSNLTNLTDKQIGEIDGIGAAQAKEIREALDLYGLTTRPYQMCLADFFADI
jgi:hypothetical protein